MGRKAEERRQRLQRKTARVFFSSPFGGLEEEREELTKKYWPRLESMCNKAGYDFIPVDLRWGITSEMSSSAVTIKVCLNEMDRSDMIVGFFGQRYGWHGDDKLLQKSFDVAAEFYPWLNDYRDKSVTELEYLHGHLRDPGARAACFFFRDKAYDDMKLEEAKKTGNEREIRKFVASTDGPHAAERLDDLKQRIEQTKDKCLAVHMSYPTPKEGARLMFETIEKYFNEVLLSRPAVKLTEREEESLQHDVFLASRLGMGGNYVGGQKYLDQIDKHLLHQENDKENRVLVLGNGGSGKSCMLSNWVTLHQMRSPQDIVIYHFVGSTSRGTDPEFIMSRIVDELNDELQDRVVHDNSFATDPKDDMRQLIRKLTGLMHRVKETGSKAFIIIDALNKVDRLGQTMKTLYWLPKDIPPSVYLIVSTLTSDSANINELNERAYHKIYTKPLDMKEREQMALTALKKRGKTLSKEQQQRVFTQKQTENPLYLEILLMELVSFGEFFQLDSYIDSLIQANDTKGLFLKYLERLEKDYNPEEYHGNLAEEITCCIHSARNGLSEKEIRSILGISNQVWSSIFFAMDDFLIERDGLYSFSFKELGEAIEERYFKDNDKKKEYIRKIADYFDGKLKERSPLYNTTIPSRIYSELPWLLTKLGDKDRLVECILKPPVFYSLKGGQSKYELIAYWNMAGLSDDEIAAKQQKVIDDQLALFYNEVEELGGSPKYALDMMIPFVYDLAQFLISAGHVKAAEPILERALQMTKSLHKIEDIRGDPVLANKFCNIGNALACHYVDTEQFDKADLLHHEVLELKEKFEHSMEDGTKSLANTLNGLGVLNFRQSKYQEALNFYQRSLEKQREAHAPQNEIAELLNNIGTVYHALGQWEDAVEKLKESLEIYEEAFFGSLPADVGGTMLNLAMAYRRLDKYEEAEPLYLRALEIRENAYGENHHEVGQTLLSYSAFLLSSDQPEKAAECSKRAAKIYENSLGLDHIGTLNALENVAFAYLVMKQPAEAHPYFKKAGERKEATDRMDTSVQRLNAVMGDYYLNSGQNDEARKLFSRIVKASFATDRDFAALDYLDSELPPDERPKRKREHTLLYAIEKFPTSVMILGRIQELYSKKGDAKEMVQVLKNGEFGVEHYNSAYQAFIKHNHKKEGIALLVAAHEKFPDDKIIMYNLASAHAAYKDYTSASRIFKELLNNDPNDLSTLESYANVLSLTGRIQEGRDLYNKALKLAEEASDKTAVDRLSSRIKLLSDM